MNILGHSIEIWVVAILATFTKLRSTEKLSVKSTLSISFISMSSAVLFYESVMILFGLSGNWELFVVALIALTSEDIMKNVLTASKNSDFIQDIIKVILKRK
ncbi:MAG: hypothetical protein ACOCWG_06185 [bacterium]